MALLIRKIGGPFFIIKANNSDAMIINKTKILGTGAYLPKKIVSNFDLEKTLDTSDQWIFERTGIKNRRVASREGKEFTTDMAMCSSIEALKVANIDPNEIEMILMLTATPDMPLPNSASILQTKLGITNKCPCLDLSAACSGFVYGLTIANSLIQTGQMKYILLVASEMLSSIINWEDRSSCILFGDGSGACVLGRTQDDESSQVLSSILGADGTGKEFLDCPYGGCVNPINYQVLKEKKQYINMKGKDMFKVATRTMVQNAKIVLDKANLTLDNIDWIIPHQANARIIEATVKKIGVDPKKVIVNIENYGNTSAVSIPLAFHEATRDNKIRRGDTILFDAFGAGLTSGATIIRY